jgi:hypothetical protein
MRASFSRWQQFESLQNLRGNEKHPDQLTGVLIVILEEPHMG